MGAFVEQLDKRFRDMAKREIGRVMCVSITTKSGRCELTISRSDWAKCRSRSDRYALIEGLITGPRESVASSGSTRRIYGSRTSP